MATTVNVVCYKWKTLKNGEHPLMLCICKDRKRKYQSIGLSIHPKYWDFDKNQTKPTCPNKEYINQIITDKLSSINTEIIRLQSEKKEFTLTSILEDTQKQHVGRTVNDIFLRQIQQLKEENRRGYMLSFKQVYNSLIAFNGHLDIFFSDIDVSFLRNYEAWLRKNGLAENTIGIRFRTLRALFNIAIDLGVVNPDCYPFRAYKVSKHYQQTAKRALSKEDIESVFNYKTTNPYVRFSIDIFAFTYYCGGINFIDVANLTSANIIDGKLIYKRHKTGKLIKIPLQKQALTLVQKYKKRDAIYLFPILSSYHQTDIQKANRIHKVITKINNRLKQIGEELELPLVLTTYVARHTQATVMKKAGVSTAVIKEIMGHSSERVTQIYLDSFDNEQINKAMNYLV
jgi:integrase